MAATVKTAPPGQQAYTTAGTYTFTVPAGVTAVSVVCVGGGQGSNTGQVTAGAGGSLSYENNISTTPGESLTVIVGAAGVAANGTPQSAGASSNLKRSATTLCQGKGGSNTDSNVGTAYTGGAFGASSGFFGTGAGGGGAGGYSANGGAGGNSSSSPTSGASATGGGGGGGGGGNLDPDYYSPGVGQAFAGGGGGGVGILGTGTNGAGGGAGAEGGGGGGGGSGGSNGVGGGISAGAGGAYGGGAGQLGYNEQTSSYGSSASGGVGAVRIIWGAGRSYPSNAANV